MSREDPQFKLRMPAELRAQAEQAAKAAGRSLNAELVTRIGASFISESSPDDLMTAKEAREIALMSRAGIPEEIRRRAIGAINRAARLGHSETFVDLNDLNLDHGIPDKDLDELFKGVISELEKAGYTVKSDDITVLWIKF